MITLELLDYIEIKQLNIPVKIGVHEWEKQTTQQLLLDLKIFLNLEDCNDELGKTLCYQTISEQLIQHLQHQPIELLETVAKNTMSLIMEHANVMAVEVIVYKKHVLKHVQHVAVRMFRSKEASLSTGDSRVL